LTSRGLLLRRACQQDRCKHAGRAREGGAEKAMSERAARWPRQPGWRKQQVSSVRGFDGSAVLIGVRSETLRDPRLGAPLSRFAVRAGCNDDRVPERGHLPEAGLALTVTYAVARPPQELARVRARFSEAQVPTYHRNWAGARPSTAAARAAPPCRRGRCVGPCPRILGGGFDRVHGTGAVPATKRRTLVSWASRGFRPC
jgi:hypothetical protein